MALWIARLRVREALSSRGRWDRYDLCKGRGDDGVDGDAVLRMHHDERTVAGSSAMASKISLSVE